MDQAVGPAELHHRSGGLGLPASVRPGGTGQANLRRHAHAVRGPPHRRCLHGAVLRQQPWEGRGHGGPHGEAPRARAQAHHRASGPPLDQARLRRVRHGQELPGGGGQGVSETVALHRPALRLGVVRTTGALDAGGGGLCGGDHPHRQPLQAVPSHPLVVEVFAGVASLGGLRDHQGASDHGVRGGQPVETRGHVGSDPGSAVTSAACTRTGATGTRPPTRSRAAAGPRLDGQLRIPSRGPGCSLAGSTCGPHRGTRAAAGRAGRCGDAAPGGA
mmetsp:Transcript_16666/g.50048  ORF Transcript_16666/g.50048 Transcript_16666/m.50048 type:complete len:274 (+) Transcript_16666:798-1619(+)